MAKHRNSGQNFVYNQLTINLMKDNNKKVIFVPSELSFDEEQLLTEIKNTFPEYEVSFGEVLNFTGDNREVLDDYTGIDNSHISEIVDRLNVVNTVAKDQIKTRTEFITLCIEQRKK